MTINSKASLTFYLLALKGPGLGPHLLRWDNNNNNNNKRRDTTYTAQNSRQTPLKTIPQKDTLQALLFTDVANNSILSKLLLCTSTRCPLAAVCNPLGYDNSEMGLSLQIYFSAVVECDVLLLTQTLRKHQKTLFLTLSKPHPRVIVETKAGQDLNLSHPNP